MNTDFILGILLWAGIGFVSGAVIMIIEIRRMDKPPVNRFESLVRRLLFHGVWDKDAVLVAQALLKGEAPTLPTRRTPRLSNGDSVGDCACGCGEKVLYSGKGRHPRFVNDWHKEYFQGKRRTPYPNS